MSLVLSGTTYTDSGVRLDARRRVDVEIGDSKQDYFVPQFKQLFHDNNHNISLRLVDDAPDRGVFSQRDGTVEWSRQGRTARLYQKTDLLNPKAPGTEFEVSWQQAPLPAFVDFTVMSKGLNLRYQPPLDEEWEGHPDLIEATATDVWLSDPSGEVRHFQRPLDVVGSYALRFQGRGGFDPVPFNDLGQRTEWQRSAELGQISVPSRFHAYTTGKAAHLYRPEIYDAVGNKTYCDMNISSIANPDGTLLMRVTIPASFRDRSDLVYPVVLDPTLGITGEGGSQDNQNDFVVANGEFTGAAGAAGTATAYAYVSHDSSSIDCGLGLYDDQSTSPASANLLDQSGTIATTSTSATWETNSFTIIAIAASTPYWVALLTSSGGNSFYDSGSNETYWYNAGGWGSGLDDPFNASPAGPASRDASWYFDYPAAGGTVPLLSLLGVGS